SACGHGRCRTGRTEPSTTRAVSAASSVRTTAWSSRRLSLSFRATPTTASGRDSGAGSLASHRPRRGLFPKPDSVDVALGDQRQELGKLLGQRDLLEPLPRFAEPALLPPLFAVLGAQAGHLVIRYLSHEIRRHARPFGQPRRMPAPLPDLRSRNLGGADVLHQVVDGRRPHAA